MHAFPVRKAECVPITDPAMIERLASELVARNIHRANPTAGQIEDGEPGSLVIPWEIYHSSNKAKRAYITAVLRLEEEFETDASRRRREFVRVSGHSECRHCGLDVFDHPVDVAASPLRIMCWRQRVKV